TLCVSLCEIDRPYLTVIHPHDALTVRRRRRLITGAKPLRRNALDRGRPDRLLGAFGQVRRIRGLSLSVCAFTSREHDVFTVRRERQLRKVLPVVHSIGRDSASSEVWPVGDPDVSHTFDGLHPREAYAGRRCDELRRKWCGQ